MPKTKAADQFAALGLNPSDWTPTMALAVKQRWTDLPIETKVGDLREQLAALVPAPVPPVGDVKAAMILERRATVADDEAAAEHRRLKRNAAVNHWRARNQIKAALEARDAKFAKMRARRGQTAAPRPGTETGDRAPVSVAS